MGYRVKRFSSRFAEKLFMIDPKTGEFITGEQMMQQNNWKTQKDPTTGKTITVDANGNRVNKTQMQTAVAQNGQNVAQQQAQRAANRKANIANAPAVKEAAVRARTQGYQAGQQAGARSVGVMGGMKNTWNNAGTMGKAGMIAGGVALTGLALNGLRSKKSDKEK